MRKYIENKCYDTETAKLIGDDWYSNPGDFEYWSEELYRKKTGEYFLYGEGGPASKYSVAVDQNSWSGGAKITPLTKEAARVWAEEHLSAEKYEAEFVAGNESELTAIFRELLADIDGYHDTLAGSGLNEGEKKCVDAVVGSIKVMIEDKYMKKYQYGELDSFSADESGENGGGATSEEKPKNRFHL